MSPKVGDFWQVNFEDEQYTAIVQELYISTEIDLTEEDKKYWNDYGVMDEADMPPEYAHHRPEWIYKADGSLKDPSWTIPVKILNYHGWGDYYTDLDPSAFIKQVPPVKETPKPDFADIMKAFSKAATPKPIMPIGIILGAGIILLLLVNK